MRHTRRRRVLKVGGAALVGGSLSALAGCTWFAGGSASRETPPDVVPSPATGMLSADVERIRENRSVERVVNGVLEPVRNATPFVEARNETELLDYLETHGHLDPRGLKRVVAFDRVPGEGTTAGDDGAGWYVGARFTADWDASEVLDALRSRGTSFEETTVRGNAVYRPTRGSSGPWFGEIRAGEYVLGTRAAVEDALDVAGSRDRDGSPESLGRESALRTIYEGGDSGLLRAATTTPQQRLPAEAFVLQGGGNRRVEPADWSDVDPTHLADVEGIETSLSHEEDRLQFQVRFHTRDVASAADLQDVIAGGIAGAESTVETEGLREALATATVDRAGDLVSLRYESPVETVTGHVREFVRAAIAANVYCVRGCLG